MNTNDLIAHAAESSGATKAEAKKIVDAFLAGITASLKDGKEVTINSIGKLSVTAKPERQGRNPRTGESIVIPPGKRIKFAPSKTLKDAV